MITFYNKISKFATKTQLLRTFVGISIDPHYDFKSIVDNPTLYKENLRIRNRKGDIDEIISLYLQYGQLTRQLNDLKNEKNINSKVDPKDPIIIQQGRERRQQIMDIEHKKDSIYANLIEKQMTLPNLTSSLTPIGPEKNAKLIEYLGTKPEFSFKPKNNYDIVKLLDLADFETGTLVSAPRFTYIKNALLFWEQGITMYILNKLSSKGYTCMETPDIVQQNAVVGCGFNPRGDSTQIYNISNGDTEKNIPLLSLIGTSEIPLGCYNYNKILKSSELPLRYCGLSHCFRREAGASGTKDKGLYRVHQFTKIEMYHVCLPSQSEAMFNELVTIQKEICNDMKLHVRLLEMPTEELGNSAYRKIDFEAYMPGREDYGEICSISNCTDYQSRRLNIRTKVENQRVYCHTLNGTAVALPRLFVAILENYQMKDGTVVLPECFKSYVPEQYHMIKPISKKNTK